MKGDDAGRELYFIPSEELDHKILDMGDCVEIKHKDVNNPATARILKKSKSRTAKARYYFIMQTNEDDKMHVNYMEGDSMKLIGVYGDDLNVEIRRGRIFLSYEREIINNVINSSMGYDIEGLMVFFHDYAGPDDFPMRQK